VNVDFGKTASDYARYRVAFPERMLERLAERGIGDRGQRVLDLGTGTGCLARQFALRGCEVVGIDPSEELIEEAKRIDDDGGVRVHYVVAKAERTTLDESSFDVVAAGRCWHWLDHNKAIREIKRVIKPNGYIALAQFDWLPMPGNAIGATERLIEKYSPEWKLGGGNGLHGDWLNDIRRAGFTEIETFSFDVTVSYSHEAWRGRVRASASVRATMSPDMVARFDESLRQTLATDHESDPLELPHCVWVMHARAPG
jgi:SAM-dependent methyltransferase